MVYREKHCRICKAVITWGQSDTACTVQCRNQLPAESYRIEHHKEASYRKNRPCCLWLGEWAKTLRHYTWCCTFCQGPFESLDHFVPVSQGSATWVGNVVPACLQCQIAKGNLLSMEVETIPQKVIERVARYLQRHAQSNLKHTQEEGFKRVLADTNRQVVVGRGNV